MNKKSAARSAFFTPRFLISFAFCLAGLVLALVTFAIYPGGNAIARESTAPQPVPETVNGVPMFYATPQQQETEAPIVEEPAVPLPVSGNIDMAALGIHPLAYPAIPKAWQNGPDSAGIGSAGVFMQTSNDFVNQSTTAAFASLSTGWTTGETVAFSLNGGTPTNFTVNASGTLVYLGITISTGSGFGYITIDAVGNTSGKRAGAVVQVAPTGPYLPGVASSPHGVNTSGTGPLILMFGTGYPINSTVSRYRNGTLQSSTVATSSLGLFFVGVAPTNNGNTSAVYSADTTAIAGSMNGASDEERSDAGTPPLGDQNTTRAFVDRAVLNSATGGVAAFSGEGFNAGETVNITTCATGTVTADANGAASFFLNIAAGAGTTNCVMTGATSAKVGRASVLSSATASNRRGLIVSPSSGNNVGSVTVLASKLPANDTGFVYLDGTQVGTVTSNSVGAASLTITKPNTPVGAHEVGYINSSGTGDAQATLYLLMTAGPTPTPSPSPTPSPTPTTPTPSPSPTPTPSTPTPTPPATVCQVAEDMEDITNLVVPKGWWEQNNSTLPAGTTSWFQGTSTVFPAFSGAGYIGANYNNTGGTTGTEVISNWLLTPPVTLQNGGLLSFYTRTTGNPASFPDRLQVRYTTATGGNSTWVGTNPEDVGNFTNLLLDINPGENTTSYPGVWTNFTVALSGFGLPIKGRLAFRYYVHNAGPNGANSDYIGIDAVSYSCIGGPTPTPAPTPTPTPTPTATATPVGCQVLYDQTDSPDSLGNGTSSQDFETADDAFDDQTADDFVIPGGQTWNIQQVYAQGFYSAAGGPTTLCNLYFYSDTGGLPGAAVGTYLNAALATELSGSVAITVPGGGLTLGPGTYWVSVQARMDFATGGQWYWADRSVQSNNGAAWQNPGGGFAAGCTTWGRRSTTCAIDSASTDQIFRLYGCQPTATPGTVTISGNVNNCASPAPTATPPATPTPPTLPPVPNVLMTLSGSSSGTTLTNASGAYSFTVAAGGTYTVTPSKGPLAPGSGINTTDVLAIQRHFLGISLIPAGCRLTAADVNVNGSVNTQDVLAVQRFFLGFTSGTASTGQYKFAPASSSYPAIGSNAVTNYTMYVLGDVAAPFNNRPGDVAPDAPTTVAAVMLPDVSTDVSKTDFMAAVRTSAVDGRDNIVGFQGDFTFDERVVSFATEPVQAAGLTARNWNVAGNILPGNGPTRTLRISGYSTDFAPLNGIGTLFNLRVEHMNSGGGSSPLMWSAPPDNFIFINGDLMSSKPGNTSPGSVRPSQR